MLHKIILYNKSTVLFNMRHVIKVKGVGKKLQLLFAFPELNGVHFFGSGDISTQPYKEEITFETEEEVVAEIEKIEQLMK